MRIQRVIKTIEWLERVLLPTEFFDCLMRSRAEGPDTSTPERVLTLSEALQRLSRVAPRIESNPAAMEVLAAFKLEGLLTLETGQQLLRDMIQPGEKRPSQELARSLLVNWNKIRNCKKPLTLLTIPAELRGEEEPDDILSLQLRTPEGKELPLAELTTAMKLIQDLYDNLARVYKKEEAGRLVIVKIESGSTVEINAKGAGGVVKELTKFFMDAWEILRYRGPDKVMANNEALLSTLDVHKKIEGSGLEPEEKRRLKRLIVSNTVKLIGLGVLPAEVEDEESVSNVELLEVFSQKMLPAPKEVSKPKSRKRQPATKKAKTKPKKG